MNKKVYIIRSIKYLIWLMLLFILLFLLMLATETSQVDAGQSIHELFNTRRGQLMLGVIVVLAALYPKFGFTQRTVPADLTANRELILKTFHANNYTLIEEQGNVLIFRASSPLKRVLMMGEDRITVTGQGNSIVITGIRIEVVKAEFRLKSFL